MLYLGVKEVWGFIQSPFGQTVIWGSLTVWAFTYAMAMWLIDPREDKGRGSHVVASGVMCIFWIINTLMWVTSSVDKMLYSDAFFVALSIFIYYKVRHSWCLCLAGLYAISVLLDITLWYGLDQSLYAWLSNGVYVFQLLIASGLATRWNLKIHPRHFLPQSIKAVFKL